jgi:hypothetical protein
VVVVVVDSKAAVRRAVRAAVRQATKRQERVFRVRVTTAALQIRMTAAEEAAVRRLSAQTGHLARVVQAVPEQQILTRVAASPTREAVVAVAPQLAAQAGQVAAVLGEATPQAPTALRTSAEAAAVQAVRMSAATAVRASSSSAT